MIVGRRSRVLGPRMQFAFVCLPLFLTALQYHMVSVGLADMIDDLDAPLRWVSWVLTAFTIASASSQPVAGRLGDAFGARRVFAVALLVFSAASMVCAAAPNVWILIVGRLAQGVAAGALMPTAFGLIAAAFPEQRSRAIGLVSSVVPIGTLVGPNLGGFVVERFGWRGTFMLNVPTALGLGLAAMVLLPASVRRRDRAMDLRGASMLALSIFALVYALTELSADEPQWDVVVGATVAVLVIGGAFVAHERSTEAPVVDVDLLRNRAFAAANALHFLYGVVLLGLFGFVPLYVQTVYGMSPSESGLVLTPRALAMAGVSALTALVLKHTGYRLPIAAGMSLMAVSAIVLSLSLQTPTVAGIGVGNLAWVTAVVTLTGIAYGLVGPPLNNVALELAPDRVAAIAGLRGTFRSVGGATGTALIVLVVTRAPTTGQGLERAFMALGVVSTLSLVLVRWIPEPADDVDHRSAPRRGFRAVAP